MTGVVLIPFGLRILALDQSTFEDALRRGDTYVSVANGGNEAASRAQQTELVDADGLARALSVEASWALKRARLREIPFVQVGKYVRFSVSDVIAHLRAAE